MTSPRIIPPVPPFATPNAPAVALDAAGCISVDVTCRKCGYNLRGLLPDGRCPECGTAVGRSLHGDFFRFCDPAWVRRLASGVNWIIASVALGIIVSLAPGINVATLNLSPLIIHAIILWVIGALGLYGYWLYTTPDPTMLTAEGGLTARKLVRIAQVVGWAAMPVSLTRGGFVPEMLAIVIGLAYMIITIVGVFATFVYTRRLARRIPDDSLARSFGAIMWAIVFLMSLGLTTGILAGIGRPSSPTGQPAASWYSVVVAMGCLALVAGLVIGLLLLISVLRFRRALSKAADTADATWAVRPPEPIPPTPSKLGLV